MLWNSSFNVCSVTPWNIACQAPLSMEFSRQENWGGLPFPSPGLHSINLLYPYSVPLNGYLTYWVFLMPKLIAQMKRTGESLVAEKGNEHLSSSFQAADFPGGSDGKASAYNAGDPGSIPGLGRPPGEGNGNRLQILAWKIPWTEEPEGLQSMGS